MGSKELILERKEKGGWSRWGLCSGHEAARGLIRDEDVSPYAWKILEERGSCFFF